MTGIQAWSQVESAKVYIFKVYFMYKYKYSYSKKQLASYFSRLQYKCSYS